MEKLTRTSWFTPIEDERVDDVGMLSEGDRDQTEYFGPLARLQGRALHRPGVAAGLEVSGTIDSSDLLVSPGVAVDADGHLIALAAGGQAEVGAPTPVEVPVAGLEVPTGTKTGDFVMTVAWNEVFDRHQLEASEGRTHRVNHIPRFAFKKANELGAEHVVLAGVVLEGGKLKRLDAGGRSHAGAAAGHVDLHLAVDGTSPPTVRHDLVGQVAADRDGVIVRVTDGGDDLSDAFSATTNTVAAIGPTGEAWLAVNRNSGEVRVDNLTITGGHLDTDDPDTPLNVHGTLALDGRTAVRAGDNFRVAGPEPGQQVHHGGPYALGLRGRGTRQRERDR